MQSSETTSSESLVRVTGSIWCEAAIRFSYGTPSYESSLIIRLCLVISYGMSLGCSEVKESTVFCYFFFIYLARVAGVKRCGITVQCRVGSVWF